MNTPATNTKGPGTQGAPDSITEIVAPAGAAPGTAIAAYDYGAEDASGFEHVDAKMYVVPLLDILQAKSKEVENDNPAADAKSGNFIIRAFGEYFDGKNGIAFVPCGTQEVLNEWIPKDAGGGLVAVYDPTSQFAKDAKAKQRFGKIKMENGHELVETHYLYGLLVREDGSTNMISVPFTSSKIARMRTLLTKARGVTVVGKGGVPQNVPLFGHVYIMKTVLVEKKGHKWQNFQDILWKGGSALAARLDPNGPLYAEARTFAKQVKDRLVKVDTNDMAKTSDADVSHDGDDDDTGGAGLAKGENANIPF